jgi:hypothetical protein
MDFVPRVRNDTKNDATHFVLTVLLFAFRIAGATTAICDQRPLAQDRCTSIGILAAYSRVLPIFKITRNAVSPLDL